MKTVLQCRFLMSESEFGMSKLYYFCSLFSHEKESVTEGPFQRRYRRFDVDYYRVFSVQERRVLQLIQRVGASWIGPRLYRAARLALQPFTTTTLSSLFFVCFCFIFWGVMRGDLGCKMLANEVNMTNTLIQTLGLVQCSVQTILYLQAPQP